MSRAATGTTRESVVIFRFEINLALRVRAVVAVVLVVAARLVPALVPVGSLVARRGRAVGVVVALFVITAAALVSGGLVGAAELLLVHLAADERPSQGPDARADQRAFAGVPAGVVADDRAEPRARRGPQQRAAAGMALTPSDTGTQTRDQRQACQLLQHGSVPSLKCAQHRSGRGETVCAVLKGRQPKPLEVGRSRAARSCSMSGGNHDLRHETRRLRAR